jgi:glucosyl-3-phosphoglycerate phosphatase
VLWRHGQTTFNAERRFQGQLDVPLNEVGIEQAAVAARYIAALRPSAIFSSDLSRAAQTAATRARLTGLSVKHDPDLRERRGGDWEGLSDTQLRQDYGQAYAHWTSAPADWAPPGGESGTMVADRAWAGLLRAADSVPGGSTVVVVSHGGAIGLGTARLLGIAPGLRLLGTLGNCRWSVLGRRDGLWRLLEHNVGTLPVPVADVEAEAPVEAGDVGAPAGGTRREE